MAFAYQQDKLPEKNTNLKPCLILHLELLIMLVKHMANCDL